MKMVFSFAAMIGLTVLANLLLKLGAVAGNNSADGLLGFVNWRVIAGLASFGASAMMYLIVLRKFPLNVAQSFAAFQFVAVIIASSLYLGEPIGTMRWVGIAVIVTGIFIVGRSLP